MSRRGRRTAPQPRCCARCNRYALRCLLRKLRAGVLLPLLILLASGCFATLHRALAYVRALREVHTQDEVSRG